MKKILFFAIFSCLIQAAPAQFYSGSQMEFGKNRVQYDEPRLWQWYKFSKYNVYFYMGGKELAMYTAQRAEKFTAEIEKTFDYTLDDKIEFMVFNKQSDYRQSNIGLEYEEPYNVGGVTKVVGSKVFLYFDGDHTHYDRKIRAAITEVLINQMMYGGNVRDVVKNSTLLTLPSWYLNGLISYVSYDWDPEIDARVKDGILTGSYRKFNSLDGIDAIYAGHSIWNYIAETYGQSVISNILYMTKVTRNVESAFLFVLGVSMKNLTTEWMLYYSDRYNEKDTSRTIPETTLLKRPKANRVYQRLEASPDGRYAIFTTNEWGQYKVWLWDRDKQKARKIMKREKKLDRPIDYSYPILAWHPSGDRFSIITERKGEILLTYYTMNTKKLETLKIFNFEKIVDVAYSDDGKQFVMSAVQNGQSDLFLYTPGSGNFENITKDIYDDLQPQFIDNSSRIIFTSNRPGDTIRFQSTYPADIKPEAMPMEKKDLFIYNFKARSPILRRVTNTPKADETHPFEYGKDHLCFLSDENGIRNRFAGTLDSAIAYVDTAAHYRYFTRTFPLSNFSYGLYEQDIQKNNRMAGQIFYHNKRYRLNIVQLPEKPEPYKGELKNTAYRSITLKTEKKKEEIKKENEQKTVETIEIVTPEIKEVPKADSTGIDIRNYVFVGEQLKVKPINTETVTATVTTPDTSSAPVPEKGFTFPQQRNYFVFFSTDYVVTQLDNSFLNASYQKFSGPGPVFLSPGFTGFFKLGLSDLFDDYKVSGGFRISSDLRSNEYYMSYENRLRRLDKQIVLHRQALDYAPIAKVHTHQAKYVLKWPFTETASLRGNIAGRQDRTVWYGFDKTSLGWENDFEYWGSSLMEFVFDNTRKRGLNLYYGTRLKFFAEYFKQINKKETDIYILGMDVRHYTKIHRDFIWANRIAASTSFGKKKLVYYMGGVDNWFSPQFNYETPIATDQNYAYQTLATPMRGFYQNIRNGNSFAVINSELRLPLFRYLMNKPLKSDFLNNFQVVGYGDVGTAWTGKSPYDEANSLNTQVVGGPPNPITVIVETRREPIVAGYGWGIRSRLLGYFMRLDWSHGWEDGNIHPRVFYWSFSLDF